MSKKQSQPLTRLERTIAARAKNPNPKSYTCQLLDGGLASIGAKVTEEAREVVEAAAEVGPAGREHFIYEVGDLVYHLLVLMRLRECTLLDLEAELARRFGVSGIAEKAARKTAAPQQAAETETAAKPRAPAKKAASQRKAATKPKAKAKAKAKTTVQRKKKSKR
jgi:phosphoribosyl-ATP pyrophosphohydrolase